jgi:hypothetical protein
LTLGSERRRAEPNGAARVHRSPGRRSACRLLFSALVSLLLGVTSQPAGAFCRSRTCASKCTEDPITTCPIEGVPIAWPGSCVSYTVQRDGSLSISHAELSRATDAAFQTWQNVRCPSNGSPSLAVGNLYGVTSCGRVEFNPRQANANIVVIRDDWVADPTALALTTVSINSVTGQIYDADMEINGTQPLSIGPLSPNRYDLESIITHEAGHFFGVAHSNVGLDQNCHNGATMCPYYLPGVDDFRSLHEDDIAAICTIYPPDRVLPQCDPTPHRGFSPECGMDPMTGGACSVAISRGRTGAGWLTALVAGWGAGVCRRRRARRRAQKLT